MKYLLSIFILFIISACSLKDAPVLNRYTLGTQSIMVVTHSSYHNKTIKVSFPQTLKEKISTKIHYSYSSSQRGVYQNSQWSNNIGKLLQGSVIQILDESRLFKAVLPYESTAGEDFRLESTLFDFSHYLRGDASYAVVSLQFALIDSYTGRLLKTKRFSYKEDTITINAKGYVEATQKIMNRLSRDLLAWLR
jgi:cholesterol transport system auxiliary component